MQEEIADWKDELEWETVDSTPDMVLGDPILAEQRRLREERLKVEEADHKLTEELFNEKSYTQSYKDNNVIGVYKKIKSSGKTIVHNIIKNTSKIKIKNISIKKSNIKKISDEFTLNAIDDTAMNIEDNYYRNKSL